MPAAKKKYGITIVNKNKLIIFATKLRNRKILQLCIGH